MLYDVQNYLKFLQIWKLQILTYDLIILITGFELVSFFTLINHMQLST